MHNRYFLLHNQQKRMDMQMRLQTEKAKWKNILRALVEPHCSFQYFFISSVKNDYFYQ